VSVWGKMSQTLPVVCGVPQGSVLGPLLYTMYTKSIGEICRRHNVLYHCYADDIQLYCAAEGSEDLAARLSSINECIDELKSWMGCNMLKLNSEKTEFIIFASKKSPGRNITPSLPWHLRDTNISSHVRSLGVIFDSALSFAKHIDYIFKSCNFYIINIGRIRQFLSKKTYEMLVVALVTSRLDYCNSLLNGLSQTHMLRLQRVQNTVTRLICRIKKFDHISTSLQSLHWLPVLFRPRFKLLYIVFRALRGVGPLYLQELICPYRPTRSLRSENKNLLYVPACHTATYGNRLFTVETATLWNDLPQEVRDAENLSSFKRLLKTHFVNSAFPQNCRSVCS